MELTDVRAGLASVIGGQVAGLHVYTRPPNRVDVPAALLLVTGVDYLEAMGGGLYQVEVTLTCLVARNDERTAFDTLDGYMSPSGASSIRAALATDRTLGGLVADAQVIAAGRIGEASANGLDFLAVEFQLEVHGT